MATTPTQGQTIASIFGITDLDTTPGALSHQSSNTPSVVAAQTPPSAVSSTNNTFIMSNSPVKTMPVAERYRPRVTRTIGQRPACLVNATMTYCGNNQIYAFGGFDQYTDEVYNHVLRLDLTTHQWNLVDNYGDIPGVRMGHTATLYKGDKLLIFGGENEHRTYLSDLIIFDLKTAHWTQPTVSGPIPKGRARHAATLHEDKLFIIGGITGQNNYVLDDICYLDLKTFTWSKTWRFVSRFDHSACIWGDRVWVFGGLSEDMDKVSDLWWLDLKGSPEFDSRPQSGIYDRQVALSRGSPRPPHNLSGSPVVGASGYAANSRTAQVNPPSVQLKAYAPMAPGAIAAMKFVGGAHIPSQGSGIHYHAFSSGTLLDFVSPSATTSHRECSLSALDLTSMRWEKLADGREMFKSGYRWHYCTMNEDGTKAWLLGCPLDPTAAEIEPGGFELYLSDVMEVDLRRYGLLGNNLAPEPNLDPASSHMRRVVDQPVRGLGADLASLFNQPPESGSGTDFIITALADGSEEDSILSSGIITGSGGTDERGWLAEDAPTSQPIHVHKLILQARWPHFARLYNAQMAEFHTKKMHIPEPYPVVKAFLLYLYTDSISGTTVPNSDAVTDLADIAGLLVLSNLYNLPRLRLLCVNRLSKELDVEHACVIWYCAGLADEEWLRKRAAGFCMTHWGRIVRTKGFLSLPRNALVELSQEIDMEGRVIAGDELEWGSMGNGRFSRKESIDSQAQLDSEVDDDDEGMEMN